MKNIHILIPVILLGLFACKAQSENQTLERPDMHNSQLALDWSGVYLGQLPCADCEGILTEVQLFEDQRFTHHAVYLGKSKEVYSTSGNFKWNENGNSIVLFNTANTSIAAYHVGENKLFLLDQDGKRIEGELAGLYTLEKISHDTLSNTFFKADKIDGLDVSFIENQNEIVYIQMDTITMKIYGHAGCNTFRGGFKLEGNNEIQFSPMATTMMACNEDIMTKEQGFLSIFERTTKYSIKNDSLIYYDDNNNEVALFTGLRLLK